jgi:predicted flap endonuclease-1-like 5' DNA nuclease
VLEMTEEIVLYLIGTGVAGLIVGWLLHSQMSKSRIDGLEDEWQAKVDDVIRQRDRFTVEIEKLKTSIETQQGVVHRHEVSAARAQTDLESANEKSKSLTKDIFTLRAEREDFKNKVGTIQDALAAVQQQTVELQTEFLKSSEFYKGELKKSFEKRKELNEKLHDAKLEHESFSNLLQSSRSEKDSVNKMLDAAQTRLDNLDALEQKVIELEAENAQLNHDATLAQQEIETLLRDVGELDELKVQNKELAHCLKSMEHSRKQYESDAERYKQHAGQSEQKSETLRIKLDEVEKTFASLENQQRDALKDAREGARTQKSKPKKPTKKEVDDLQEIIGIGKVFESALHDLGITSFRQIANFGVTDMARVNQELKEFKGRMEQDDWVGQAKELLFKKYG